MCHDITLHYCGVIMGTMASQITSLTIVYSTVYSDAHQRKHQSSAPLAFERGIHRGPVNSPHKWPVTREMFPFDDVIMISLSSIYKPINSKMFVSWRLASSLASGSVCDVTIGRTKYHGSGNCYDGTWEEIFNSLDIHCIRCIHVDIYDRIAMTSLKVIHKDVKPFLNDTVKKICFHVDL